MTHKAFRVDIPNQIPICISQESDGHGVGSPNDPETAPSPSLHFPCLSGEPAPPVQTRLLVSMGISLKVNMNHDVRGPQAEASG